MGITGKDLLDKGFKSGKWFKEAIIVANKMLSDNHTIDDVWDTVASLEPKEIGLQPPIKANYFIDADTDDEINNLNDVRKAVNILATIPTVRNIAVMPDACPAGIIPVGTVVETENAIHPGFHSADVCCSVAITVIGKIDPKLVLDKAMEITHFGSGPRKDDLFINNVPNYVIEAAKQNPFLKDSTENMKRYFATQGDGNHFLYVGVLESSGDTCIVTHHGSRKIGADLYKSGMSVAEKFRKELAPSIPKEAAWIPMDTIEGKNYYDALQTVEEWTKYSHYELHDMIVGDNHVDRFWNAHNFIFTKMDEDDTYYHAKGATPGFDIFERRTIVPLNMAEPVLITKGTYNKDALEFLPHGAGRNMSRTKFLRENPSLEFPSHIDVRSFSGEPDVSEHPLAYKNAHSVEKQMKKYNLAEIHDRVLPYGSIMAGKQEQFWRKK